MLWEALGRLWEALGSFASFKINLGATFERLWGSLWGGFGRLWEALGDVGGVFGKSLGGFGKLWGGFQSLSSPHAFVSSPIYKKKIKLPINRFSGPILLYYSITLLLYYCITTLLYSSIVVCKCSKKRHRNLRSA